MHLTYHYANQPVIEVSSQTIVVTVVNECVPPVDCYLIPECGIEQPAVVVPDIELQIEVIVGAPAVSVGCPPFNCETGDCAE